VVSRGHWEDGDGTEGFCLLAIGNLIRGERVKFYLVCCYFKHPLHVFVQRLHFRWVRPPMGYFLTWSRIYTDTMHCLHMYPSLPLILFPLDRHALTDILYTYSYLNSHPPGNKTYIYTIIIAVGLPENLYALHSCRLTIRNSWKTRVRR